MKFITLIIPLSRCDSKNIVISVITPPLEDETQSDCVSTSTRPRNNGPPTSGTLSSRFVLRRSMYLSSVRIMGKTYPLGLSKRHGGFGRRLKFVVLNVESQNANKYSVSSSCLSFRDFPLCLEQYFACQTCSQALDKFRIVMLIGFPELSGLYE